MAAVGTYISAAEHEGTQNKLQIAEHLATHIQSSNPSKCPLDRLGYMSRQIVEAGHSCRFMSRELDAIWFNQCTEVEI